MGHLLIAYDLAVILIGFAALVIAGFWYFKTRESYLRDFCFLYMLFTVLMITSVLEKYFLLNIPGFTPQSWYILSGIQQVISISIVVATIHFFHELYQIQRRKALTLFFAAIGVVCIGLVLSPFGAVLDERAGRIVLGNAFQIASTLYLVSFTYALLIGFAFFRKVRSSNKKIFVAGFLLFAAIGYIESLLSFLNGVRNPVITMAAENNFLISSVPYALYGLFLLYYFLQFITPAPNDHIELSDDLANRWGITGREREIILKVLQGKSNADIASELFITLATVKTHLHNIYQKFGVDSRFDLITRVRDKRE